MQTLFIIFLAFVPDLWNILTVIYLTRKARNWRLSPLKFSLAVVLGFSVTVSVILFIGIAVANGIELRKVGYVVFVFSLNILIGFPVVYFLSNVLLGKRFSIWSSELKAPEGS